MKNSKLLIVLLSVLLVSLSGCGEKEVYKNNKGHETGVQINVRLEGGGVAKLICPVHKAKPIGSHGIECYLYEYDQKVN